MEFFKSFLRHPIKVGSIVPSSVELSKTITETAQLQNKRNIIELGSGTGVFTKEIMRKIADDATFLCLETDKQLVEITKQNCPGVTVYHDSAERMHTYLSDYNLEAYDCIISGIPWAGFSSETQVKLLNIIYETLAEGGIFVTFGFVHATLLPNGKKFRRLLEHIFGSVQRSKIVWKNLPPAFVYHAEK